MCAHVFTRNSRLFSRPGGSTVALGVRKVIGGSVEFAECDYGSCRRSKSSLWTSPYSFITLLYKYDKLFVLTHVSLRNFLDRNSTGGANPQGELDDGTTQMAVTAIILSYLHIIELNHSS